jgi:dienelactone hydrolase
VADARHYGVDVVAVEERPGAIVRDIRIAGLEDASADGPIEAYLVKPSPEVEPTAPSPAGPGLLFAHWYDPHAPNGDRTEFLDEAVGWATERGATAILPQLIFPWRADPDGGSADLARIHAEVARLTQCLDVLTASPGVDPARLAVVGHDFGAMHAVLLGTADGRPQAYVLMAAVPRWGDWFLPFWEIAEDRIDYLRALRPVDPIEQVGQLAPARLLFQFADRDFYIAPMAGFEFRHAAGDQAEVKSYEAEHDMASPAALAGRRAFLEEALGLADPATRPAHS